MSEITAYPLAWPSGWRRHQSHERQGARFSKGRTQYSSDGQSQWQKYDKVTIGESVRRVVAELGRMGVPDWDVVISSNLEVRLDGLPRSNQRAPDDPGIAVYWGKGKAKRCIAIDRYDQIADNLAAVAATLYAMRAIERHGGAEILDRAFTGFIALPAPEQPWQVLGVGANATADEIEDAYRKLAALHHPDKPSGNAAEMARINAARDDLRDRLRS